MQEKNNIRNKRKKGKRMLALLLAFLLVSGTLNPSWVWNAYAQENTVLLDETETEKQSEAVTEQSTENNPSTQSEDVVLMEDETEATTEVTPKNVTENTETLQTEESLIIEDNQLFAAAESDVKTITDWQWTGNPDELEIQQDEETCIWGLGLPGVTIDNQADFDTVVSMLPASITVTVAYTFSAEGVSGDDNNSKNEELPITWKCDNYVQDETGHWPIRSDDYIFKAELPEGYALADDASALEVTVQVEGASTLASDQNSYIFDISDGTIIIEAGATYGTWKIKYGNGQVIDNVSPNQSITLTGNCKGNQIEVNTGTKDTPVKLLFNNLTINNTDYSAKGRDTFILRGAADITLNDDTNNTLCTYQSNMSDHWGSAGLRLEQGASVVIGGSGKLDLSNKYGSINASGSNTFVTIKGGIINSSSITADNVTIEEGTINLIGKISGNDNVTITSGTITGMNSISGNTVEISGGNIDIDGISGTDITIKAPITVNGNIIGTNKVSIENTDITVNGNISGTNKVSIENTDITVNGNISGTLSAQNTIIMATAVSDKSNENKTNSIIFDGTSGTAYGQPPVSSHYEIKEGYMLTIPAGIEATFTGDVINYGTVTVNGILNTSGTFTNNGEIKVYGTLNSSNTFNNNTFYVYGTLISNGTWSNNSDTGYVYKVNDATIDGSVDYIEITEDMPFPAGDFIIIGGKLDTNFTYASNILTIINDGSFTIEMKEGVLKTTKDRIAVASNVNADITLKGVNIDVSESAFEIGQDTTVTLKLLKDYPSKLKGSYGLRIYYGSGFTIEGNGELEATGINQPGINIGASCTTNILGDVLVKTSANNRGSGMYSEGELNIKGKAQVIATSAARNSAGSGIGFGKSINIFENAQLTAIGGTGAGISGNGSLSISGNAHVTAKGASSGCETGGNINISENAVVFASCTNTNGKPFNPYNMGSVLNITGGMVFKGTEGTVTGSVTLSSDMEVPEDYTLTIPENTSLTVARRTTLTNNGTIQNNGTVNLLGKLVGNPIQGNTPLGLPMKCEYQDYDPVTGAVTTKNQQECTIVLAEDTILDSGWYVVNKDVTIAKRIEVTGNVHLILADGFTLTAAEGISVGGGNSLTIYGQSQGEATGKLNAGTTGWRASIGGGQGGSVGTITINGGVITADATKSYLVQGGHTGAGAGIGSGFMTEQKLKNTGTIIINGGTVIATGGTDAAGIGGGTLGGGDVITIRGGDVTANGGQYGAGIGGGYNSNSSATKITIEGGTVNAIGGDYSAGIGGGYKDGGGKITINGGDVTAIGGQHGAGIGSGRLETEYSITSAVITINSGEVTASVKRNSNDSTGVGYYWEAAGIGGGFYASSGIITINGGTVNATSGRHGAAIGSGWHGNVDTITINGGDITAKAGGGGGVSIGHGNNGTGGTIFISSKAKITMEDLSNDITYNWGVIETNSGVVYTDTIGVFNGTALIANLTVPEGYTLKVPKDSTLAIPSGKTLTNNGTIANSGTINKKGNLTNNGTISYPVTLAAGDAEITSFQTSTDGEKFTASDLTLVVNYGTDLYVKAIFTKGHVIKQWNDGSIEPVYHISKENINPVSLTAVSDFASYKIEYKDIGGTDFTGSFGSTTKPIKHTYGTPTTLVNPTRDGYIFDGWFITPDCMGTAIETLAADGYIEDITLYAKWTPVTYTITIPSNVTAGDDAVSITASDLKLGTGGEVHVKANSGDGYDISNAGIITLKRKDAADDMITSQMYLGENEFKDLTQDVAVFTESSNDPASVKFGSPSNEGTIPAGDYSGTVTFQFIYDEQQ